MDDANQIEVPASFTALFATPSGRLTEPMHHVRERYELCEDLAQMLTEQAGTLQFKTGLPEAALLRNLQTGLREGEVPLPPAQAQWVVTRLAELLGWAYDVAP